MYTVYIITIDDAPVYVGQTNDFQRRAATHQKRIEKAALGHLKHHRSALYHACAMAYCQHRAVAITPALTVNTRLEALKEEAALIDKYRTLLYNSGCDRRESALAPASALRSTWAPRPDTDIIATAHQYQSKTAWLLADQSGYKLAKARGIFAACVADMPRRKPRDYTAIAVTAETREKMRRAKLGRHQSAETVQKRSQAMLRHYASADPVKEAARLAKVTGRKRGWLLTADEMAYLHKDQVRCELAADEKRLLRNYRHARNKVNAVTS